MPYTAGTEAGIEENPMLILWWLIAVAFGGTYEETQVWRTETLGALERPWSTAMDESWRRLAVLSGDGRLTMLDLGTSEVLWQRSLVRSAKGPVVGSLAFGDNGLAVMAGPLGESLEVELVDRDSGKSKSLGRTTPGAQVLQLGWEDNGVLVSRTREPEDGVPMDVIYERHWGKRQDVRELGVWSMAPRYVAKNSERAFVDETARGLSRSGTLRVDVKYRIWDDLWDSRTARPLTDCPEWTDVIHVSDDGEVAYTMGQIRCVYRLKDGGVVAWETKQIPFWSALSPDGSLVAERHGKGGRTYIALRQSQSGEVLQEFSGGQGARFIGSADIIVWSDYRLEQWIIGAASPAWSVPVDGEVVSVDVAPETGKILVTERVSDDAQARVRVLSKRGQQVGLIDDVDGVHQVADSGRYAVIRVRADALRILPLDNPGVSGPRVHQAAITALVVDDACHLVSGDDEGRVRWARGKTSRTWRVRGEVRDIVVRDGMVSTLSVDHPESYGEGQTPPPSQWRIDRRAVDGDAPRRPPVIGEGFADGLLLSSGEQAVLLNSELGNGLGSIARSKPQPLPAWKTSTDSGLRGDLAVMIPEEEAILAVPHSSLKTEAAVYAFGRPKAGRRFPMSLGNPSVLAVSGKHVLVVGDEGQGVVFGRSGGSSVSLDPGKTLKNPCCASLASGVGVLAEPSGNVVVFDPRSGQVEQRIKAALNSDVTTLAISPQGTCLAIGSESGEVSLWRR